MDVDSANNSQYEEATLGGGCFWCTEAIFLRLKGIIRAIPGYSGGEIQNPTYEQVSTGKTSHVEVVHLTFDPSIISYREILEIFFSTHDPTTLNRQGADWGPQYRSVIFYNNESQKHEAEKYILELEKKKIYKNPIVTAIEPFKNFYIAEEYHKYYYDLHKNQPYSREVIAPKIEKLKKTYPSKLKRKTDS